jgi:hypothetical protein
MKVRGNLEVKKHISVEGQLQQAFTQVASLAANAAVDWNDGNIIELDLAAATGTVTLALSNPKVGARYELHIIQHATVPVGMIFPGGVNSPPDISLLGVGARTVVVWTYDGSIYYNSGGSTSGTGGGISYTSVIDMVDANVAPPTTVTNDVYLLEKNVSTIDGGWNGLPVYPGTDDGDVVKYNGVSWDLIIDASVVSAGSVAIVVTANQDANFILGYNSTWDAWDAFDTGVLDDSLLVTTTIGDIDTSVTAGDLKNKAVSAILQDMLFETIDAVYDNPTLTVNKTSQGVMRGSDLGGTYDPTFTDTQNDGGVISNQVADALDDGGTPLGVAITGPGAFNVVHDLDTAFGTDVNTPDTVGEVVTIRGTCDYAQGPQLLDNKGNSSGSPISAGSLQRDLVYTSRYPVWYGMTSERFKVANTVVESTDLGITPNTGTNGGGLALDNTWIKASALTSSLFITNLSNNTDISITSGDVHLLILTPPGITVSTLEIDVLGTWQTLASATTTISVLDGEDAGGSGKTYNVLYSRDLAGKTYTPGTPQNVRFTTSGSVIP